MDTVDNTIAKFGVPFEVTRKLRISQAVKLRMTHARDGFALKIHPS